MNHASKDLRVRRTLKAIRMALYELVLEKDYGDISITELTERAEINRKTFYLHYPSLDSLIKEVEEEIISNILEKLQSDAQNMNLTACISKFYHYLYECDEVQQKLLCDPHYYFFYEDVTNAVLKSDTFQRFFDMVEHPEVVRAYSMTITFIYRSWLQNGCPMPLDELIDYAGRLAMNGYRGIYRDMQ